MEGERVIRVLFVDDEESVLDGLRRSLRRLRNSWDMHFVKSGAEALEEMETRSYDVIVSDMRMPEMDGGQLLVRVQKRWPGTIRFVLSGYAETEAIMRTVPVAHQFLAKPTDADAIQSAVDRSIRLQRVIQDRKLTEWVGGLDTLPSLPAAYAEILEAIRDPETSIKALARPIERDTALSAKILQLVNSAFFGVANEVTSVAQAVGLLGTDQLRDIALTAEVFRPASDLPPPLVEFLETLEGRAIRTATIASRLQADEKSRDLTFTAGLLHNVGCKIFSTRSPNEYLDLILESRSTQRPLHVLEEERWGVEHGRVGAVLLAFWGLPYPIVEAAAFHNDPAGQIQDADSPAVMVHVAEALGANACAGRRAFDQPDLDLQLLDDLDLADKLDDWMAVVGEAASDVE